MSHFPPSPPSSTCLPDHYSFPLTSDPPPTDGPNTRDRLKRGLLPKSGRVRGPSLFEEGESFDFGEGAGGGGEGSFEFEFESGKGWEGVEGEGHEYFSPTLEYDPNEYSFTSSTSSTTNYVPDSFIDPLLRPSACTSSTTSALGKLQEHLRNGREQEDVFRFYPPSLVPVQEDDPLSTSQSIHQRSVSNATIVEHEDHSFEEEEDDEVVAGGDLNRSLGHNTSNGLGITKEEWLRLGGFTEDEIMVESNRTATREETKEDIDVFSSTLVTQSTSTKSSMFKLPPPPFPTPTPALKNCTPPTSIARPDLVFTLPAPPPVFPPSSIEPNYFPSPLSLPPSSSSSLSLPTPPPQFHSPSKPLSSKKKGRPLSSSSSPLKSPRKKTTTRPTPYPLPSSSSQSLVSNPTTTLSVPTSSIPPPLLSPVSSALLSYKNYPIPTIPPPRAPTTSSTPSSSSSLLTKTSTITAEVRPSPTVKKSHGRKTSVGHIPRPRNAFILFRSHIVNSGLIPKTTTVVVEKKPFPPGEGEGEGEGFGEVKVEKAVDHKNVSKLVGSIWRGLEKEEKMEWERLAEEEKRVHKELYPEYKYKPKSRGSRAKPGEGEKGKSLKRLQEEEHGGEVEKVNEGDIVVDSPASSRASNTPRSSSSTLHRPSPNRSQTTPTKSSSSRPTTSSNRGSPLSSSNPSTPNRYHHPYSRSSNHPSSSSPPKHPLSRSQTASSSSSPSIPPPQPPPHQPRLSKTSHYAQSGLGLSFIPSFQIPTPPNTTRDPVFVPTQTFPPPQRGGVEGGATGGAKGRLDEIPLFKGTSNSRLFSLGRWELRKPSSSTSTNLGRSREEEEAKEEEGEFGTRGLMERKLSFSKGGGGGDRVQPPPHQRVSSLALNPQEFLVDSGLFDDEDEPHREEEEGETFSTWDTLTEITSTTTTDWQSCSSVSSYSTAPTTAFWRSGNRQGGGGVAGGGGGEKRGGADSTFHFGSVNLFAKPPQALVGRSTSGLFPRQEGGEKGNVGLGIQWDGGGKK
ncbi:hypothetical protein JCM16303_003995 [Sporobolomyces ruberrimus]